MNKILSMYMRNLNFIEISESMCHSLPDSSILFNIYNFGKMSSIIKDEIYLYRNEIYRYRLYKNSSPTVELISI